MQAVAGLPAAWAPALRRRGCGCSRLAFLFFVSVPDLTSNSSVSGKRGLLLPSAEAGFVRLENEKGLFYWKSLILQIKGFVIQRFHKVRCQVSVD